MAKNSQPQVRFDRRTPAKGVHVQSDGPTIVWLTVCSKNRVEWIAQEPVMNSLHVIWLKEATAWLVCDYLLMPDHLHLFCAPRDPRFTIERWVAFWKDRLSKRHRMETWAWQRNVFHHRIRSARDFSAKWNYMMQNPVRKGLVSCVENWPWRGRVHDIGW